MSARPGLTRVTAAALGTIVALALVVALVSRSDGGGGSPDTAAQLVPPGAQLYLHADVDEGSSQWRNGEALVGRLPGVRRLLTDAVAQLGTGADLVELETRVRPWIGKEVALALLPDGRQAKSLILLRVSDPPGARAFLESIGRSRTLPYRGTQVRVYGALAAAFVGDYLAIGSPANVRAAIVAHGGDSLGADSTFRKAVGRLDTGSPLAYAYAPGEGARRLLAARGGTGARALRLLATPGLAAAVLTASPQHDGLRLHYAALLEPGAQLSADQGNLPFALPHDLGANTIAYLGTRGVTRVLRLAARLVGQGGGQELGPVGPLLRSLGPQGERRLIAALRPLDSKEAALVVLPPAASPSVSVIVSNTTRAEGGDFLTALQPLIDRLVQDSLEEGRVPTVRPQQVEGVEALTLRISPSLELTYAALGGRLVVSSGGPRAISQLIAPKGSLQDNSRFAPGMGDLLGDASSVVFLDLARLSALVEQAGSLQAPELRALRADLRRIGAVSVVTQSQPSAQKADIFVEVP